MGYSSRLLLVQAVVAWTILVVPPFIVTLLLYYRDYFQTPEGLCSANSFKGPLKVSDVPFCRNATDPDFGPIQCLRDLCQDDELPLNRSSIITCFGCGLTLHLLHDDLDVLCSMKNSYEVSDMYRVMCSLNSSWFTSHGSPVVEEETGENVAERPVLEMEDVEDYDNTTSLSSCGEKMMDYQYLITGSHFWIKGIALTILGSCGLLGNIITIFVLSKLQTSKNFNKLLITLATCDSLLIIYFIMEKSIVETFSYEEPLWYRVAYPYILHPLRGIIETATVYMVVAISADRFRAICHPLSERQSPFRYIVYVLGLSVTLEIPRWFEFQLINNEGTVQYWTTPLMEDPDYIRFSSYWDELIATGFVPLLALVYFNSRIYVKIRASSKFQHRFIGRGAFPKKDSCRASFAQNHSVASQAANSSNNHRTILVDPLADEGHPLRRSSTRRIATNQKPYSSRSKSLAKMSFRINEPGKKKQLFQKATQTSKANPTLLNRACSILKTKESEPSIALPQKETQIFVSGEGTESLAMEIQSSQPSSEAPFRKKREKSTMILVMIVLIFVACHAFRLAVKVYEFANPGNQTLEHYNYCEQQGRYSVPVSFFMLLTTNDIFLVFNSSVNFVIYCFVVKEFRDCVKEFFLCQK
ncbi:hypothetical protein TCAL_07428 [Tigriopus californicus]|uniref:G-protein coupled receptors family 1 profile domain-containing protein n=1 Tax=Tigriopus californicus TaxID=6832 RepID=A0A553PIC5_TIGCA|nr:uncharacterized protein LOC131880715 [Tigriopus californicus]TRY77431.1 hypothetical protein TCAL_07428 [Tigriopus californicus]